MNEAPKPVAAGGAGLAFPRRALLAAGLSALTAGGAAALIYVGGLTAPQMSSFQFSRGTALASGEEERLRGFLAEALSDARTNVVIVGHTGSAGDAAANLELSEQRADAVADLAQDVGVPAAQIQATGVGGGAPLPQDEGEADRAYQSRLARVEVTLQVRR